MAEAKLAMSLDDLIAQSGTAAKRAGGGGARPAQPKKEGGGGGGSAPKLATGPRKGLNKNRGGGANGGPAQHAPKRLANQPPLQQAVPQQQQQQRAPRVQVQQQVPQQQPRAAQQQGRGMGRGLGLGVRGGHVQKRPQGGPPARPRVGVRGWHDLDRRTPTQRGQVLICGNEMTLAGWRHHRAFGVQAQDFEERQDMLEGTGKWQHDMFVGDYAPPRRQAAAPSNKL